MLQKSSYIKVLEVFFREPTKTHFIREISREIALAQTSVRNHVSELLKEKLVLKKETKPFIGLIANRESPTFIHYKQIYNLFSLHELKNFLLESIYPEKIILFGSYLRGEDIETSDIDILIISKTKKSISLDKFEKKLKRKIHLIFVKKLEELDSGLGENVKRGFILYG